MEGRRERRAQKGSSLLWESASVHVPQQCSDTAPLMVVTGWLSRPTPTTPHRTRLSA